MKKDSELLIANEIIRQHLLKTGSFIPLNIKNLEKPGNIVPDAFLTKENKKADNKDYQNHPVSMKGI